tara:strand:- start:983 stop:1630 length:648 start_codon:yes stop_codon:yes gene_type:complete
MDKDKVISILGGTGDLGNGLAKRFLQADYKVVIGSRKLEGAISAAEKLGTGCKGLQNEEAAREGDIVILTVPFAHQKSILKDCKKNLINKIFIDATVPLIPPKVATVQLPPEGSAAQISQDILGDEVQVVSAFQNISAELLKSNKSIDCDVLVCGNKKDSRSAVIELIESIGMRAWHAGQLANSAASEALTSVLISINKNHSISHSGIRITGVEE